MKYQYVTQTFFKFSTLFAGLNMTILKFTYSILYLNEQIIPVLFINNGTLVILLGYRYMYMHQ